MSFLNWKAFIKGFPRDFTGAAHQLLLFLRLILLRIASGLARLCTLAWQYCALPEKRQLYSGGSPVWSYSEGGCTKLTP